MVGAMGCCASGGATARARSSDGSALGLSKPFASYRPEVRRSSMPAQNGDWPGVTTGRRGSDGWRSDAQRLEDGDREVEVGFGRVLGQHHRRVEDPAVLLERRLVGLGG